MIVQFEHDGVEYFIHEDDTPVVRLTIWEYLHGQGDEIKPVIIVRSDGIEEIIYYSDDHKKDNLVCCDWKKFYADYSEEIRKIQSGIAILP